MNKINPIVNMIVIGGFVFNDQPLNSLISHIQSQVLDQSHLPNTIKFIDINLFNSPFTLDTATKYVAQIITAQFSQHPVIITAYSTGGLIALLLSINFPHLIDKLILINSTPCFLSQKDWRGISKKDFTQLQDKLNNLSLPEFISYFTRLAIFASGEKTTPKIKPIDMIPIDRLPIDRSMYKSIDRFKLCSQHCHKDNLNNWLNIICLTDMREQLKQIHCPTLFLNSDNDSIVHSNNRPSVYKTNNFLKQYIMSNSSHAQPNSLELIEQINNFIYADNHVQYK